MLRITTATGEQFRFGGDDPRRFLLEVTKTTVNGSNLSFAHVCDDDGAHVLVNLAHVTSVAQMGEWET